MDRQHRIEEVREPEAVGPSIEAPGAALLGHFEPWFVVPLKQLVGDSPGGVLESKH